MFNSITNIRPAFNSNVYYQKNTSSQCGLKKPLSADVISFSSFLNSPIKLPPGTNLYLVDTKSVNKEEIETVKSKIKDLNMVIYNKDNSFYEFNQNDAPVAIVHTNDFQKFSSTINFEDIKGHLIVISSSPPPNLNIKGNCRKQLVKKLELIDELISKIPKDSIDLNKREAVITTKSRNGIQIIPNVRINNKVTGDFLLDTGASVCTINENTLNELKLNPKDFLPIKTLTANGECDTILMLLQSITIDGMKAFDLKAALNKENTFGEDKNILGIIGINFLRNFIITLDIDNNKLIIRKKTENNTK